MKMLWLFGTLGIAIFATACAIYFLVRERPKYLLAFALVAVCAALGNPFINMLVFSYKANKCRNEMLAAAKAENCVGRSTDWLRQRFGEPHQIYRNHWWYTPGPWYILLQEDYVGFQVQDGKITEAYMQIN